VSSKQGKGSFIVGFQVEPYSVKHTYSGVWDDKCAPNCQLNTCADNTIVQPHDRIPVSADKGQVEVIFTYDVEWEESDIKWASRWDVYLNMRNDQIHWFSIINSVIVLVFLSAIVAIILVRILRRDLAMYNELATSDAENGAEIREETGWKLVYGDVLRPPAHAQYLSILCGAGAQVVCMTILTLLCASFGFMSPSNRGSLLIGFVMFFLLTGVLAGYVAARMAKTLKEANQFKTTLFVAVAAPGVVFAIFFVINFFLWMRRSSGAVPFGTLIAVCLLWFCVSVPLVFLGSFMGFRKDPWDLPVRVNSIPRQIPPQPWFVAWAPSIIIGGLLPFGAVFVELFFILTSIWQHKFYYMFGFLTVVFIIFLITCAEISIVLCYLQLCSENYKWWWKSFVTGGSAAIYVFMYGVYHWTLRINADDFVSSLVFFGYLTLLCWLVFIAMGFVGVYTCFYFVCKIYGSVKID
jgi:transmembrane 9 superfamily protein 2/4